MEAVETTPNFSQIQQKVGTVQITRIDIKKIKVKPILKGIET